MLTRTAEQNMQTAPLLRGYHINPVFFPCLQVQYLSEDINRGLEQLSGRPPGKCDIIFSSANGVAAVAAQAANMKETFSGCTIIAVGKKTAQALASLGVSVDAIPEEASQQGLIAMYAQKELPANAYFFRAEEGSDALSDYFASRHGSLTLIPSYITTCAPDTAADSLLQLQNGSIDAVLLGSAKTAHCYARKTQSIHKDKQPVIAVMSTQVAQAADKSGLKVQVIAENPSFKAMLEGLNQYFTKKGNSHVF